MNITCDHCGSSVNVDKHLRCPNCGAPYTNNSQYIELKRQKNRLNEINNNEKELDTHVKGFREKISKDAEIEKYVKIIYVLIFLICATPLLNIIYRGFKNAYLTITDQKEIINNYTPNIPNISNDEENQIINVSFDENAVTENYEIKIDKITNYNYDTFETEKYRGEDIDYYNFHVVFKNKTDTFLFIENYLSLTYTDTNGNEDVIAKKHNPNIKEYNSKIESTATTRGTYTGNITFEIPKQIKDVQINYKNVEISINNFKSLITE